MTASLPAPQGGPPEAIARRIRALGPVLDHSIVKDCYAPLLAVQSREGVTVERDLRYGTHERHLLDLYRPEHGAPRAVLVFLHGGGFIRGDRQQRDNVGYRFAREGYLVLVPSYRLAPEGRWPAGAEDVVAVRQWWRANAARRDAAALPVFLGGESAGAAHVALATLARRFHPAEGLGIAGAVLISGVYNAELEWRARPQFGVATPDPRNEAYFGSDHATYPGQSTVNLIDAPPLPVFMSYAELDLLQMQVQAGELFATLVVRHGYAPELKVIPGHNHLTQVYAINTGDDTLVTPVLGFLDRQLSVK